MVSAFTAGLGIVNSPASLTISGSLVCSILLNPEENWKMRGYRGYRSTDIPMEAHCTMAQFLKMLLITVVLDTFIALFIALMFHAPFLNILICSHGYAISILVITVLLLQVLNPTGTMGIVAICTLGIAAGYMSGSLIGSLVVHRSISAHVFTSLNNILIVLVFGAMGVFIFYSVEHFKMSAKVIQKERINRLSSEKEALQANLRLLQAQVEPHFLFNTLSNILSLIDTDPPRSKLMLSTLTGYLRTSLSRTLPHVTTLEQELQMIRAYLDVQKVRMGERLNFRIDVPETLKKTPFPPMLLQPLVENAVKHGLEPKVEGGTITITAAEREMRVRIEMIDTGNGLAECIPSGVGIANVRERIRLLYGAKGSFAIEENWPHGVRAIIEVPK